jgi:hypothetical protein
MCVLEQMYCAKHATSLADHAIKVAYRAKSVEFVTALANPGLRD